MIFSKFLEPLILGHYMGRGLKHFKKGRWDEAIIAFNKCMSMEEEPNLLLLILTCKCYLKKNDWVNAGELFQKVVRTHDQKSENLSSFEIREYQIFIQTYQAYITDFSAVQNKQKLETEQIN